MQYRLVKTTNTYDGSIRYTVQEKSFLFWDDAYPGIDYKNEEEAKELLEKLRSKCAKKTIEVIG